MFVFPETRLEVCFSDGLENKMVHCILDESTRRRYVLSFLTSPRRPAVRRPVVGRMPSKGFGKGFNQTPNPFKEVGI